MRRYRRFWGFRCPPSIITGISLAPGCSRKSEANKFILLADGLDFSLRILVYLHVDVHPYMESRPKQERDQTGRFGLTHPRRGKNLNAPRPAVFRLRNRKSEKGLIRAVRTLPCPEVIEERNRMAGEIHDTLAQEFAGILLHLEAASGFDGAVNASECLAKARELAKCGLEDARRMLLGLRPKSLEGAHLCDALSVLAERFSRDCGINCTFGASGRSHKLSEEIENELYRVAQEALCNVRKHSRAGSVAILLSYKTGGVMLAIKDNGQGFAINQ